MRAGYKITLMLANMVGVCEQDHEEFGVVSQDTFVWVQLYTIRTGLAVKTLPSPRAVSQDYKLTTIESEHNDPSITTTAYIERPITTSPSIS